MIETNSATDIYESTKREEYRPLTVNEITELNNDVEYALHSFGKECSYERQVVADDEIHTTRSMHSIESIQNAYDKPVLISTDLRVEVREQPNQAVREVTDIYIAESIDIDQDILEAVDGDYHRIVDEVDGEFYAHKNTFVKGSFNEKYSIVSYAGGGMQAYVTAFDMTTPTGEMNERPMTKYDAKLLQAKIDAMTLGTIN